MEWSYPDPEKPHQVWVDDEDFGLKKRKIERPEDALGAEGRLGELSLRFEKILDLGVNQVVYAFYSPSHNIRIAYGFNREVFEMGYKPEAT